MLKKEIKIPPGAEPITGTRHMSFGENVSNSELKN